MKIDFYKTPNKIYYINVHEKQNDYAVDLKFRVNNRYGKPRYISMATNEYVTYKTDGFVWVDNLPKNSIKISKESVPTHIKKSLAYYMTVNDNRRKNLDGDSLLMLM